MAAVNSHPQYFCEGGRGGGCLRLWQAEAGEWGRARGQVPDWLRLHHSSPITNGSPSHRQPGGVALLQDTGVFVCVWRVWAQTNTAWWTKGRMMIRKTLPSAGQKTTSPHVAFTGRGPSSCMFEIWHVLCEHWMTSQILQMIFTCEEITYCVNDFTSKRSLCWLWKWRWVFVACVFKWYWI